MIDRAEILKIARIFRLHPHVIEKDYVLSWILAGIYQNEVLSEWVFQGGTSLKKCYFETYRFSEDLDFVITDSEQLDDKLISEAFIDIGDWISDVSGIDLPRELIEFELYNNPRGTVSCQGRLSYRGPLAPTTKHLRNLPRIKIDLTKEEIIAQKPVKVGYLFEYSDKPSNNVLINSFDFVEIYAGKICALFQRAHPRDIYDVITVFRNIEARPNHDIVHSVLEQKLSFRAMSFPKLENLYEKRNFVAASWKSMLRHQVQFLPPTESYWNSMPDFLNWLQFGCEPLALPCLKLLEDEREINDRTLNLPFPVSQLTKIESLRYAATHHLCVDIKIHASIQRFEPYSLRFSGKWKVVIHAARSQDAKHFVLAVKEFESVQITGQSFEPRYTCNLKVASSNYLI